MSQKTEPTPTPDREIVLSRVYDAPRELVWEAWTNPKHVVNWWGPNGFTTTIEKMDFRVGGVWKHVMRGPDGANYPNKSVFREIVPFQRIAYSHGGGREDGPGASFDAIWTFEAVSATQTRLTGRLVFRTPEDRDFVVKEFGAVEGGKQTLGRLAEHLPTMTPLKEFAVSRVFNAPRELVWKAWTEVGQLQQWFGPKGFTTPTCTLELKVGGTYHYCLRSADGHELWGKWVFVEIVSPEKLVVISSFSDAQGGVTRHPMAPIWPLETYSTMTLTESGGKTTLTLRWLPYRPTDEEREKFDSNHPSMQQGWGGTLDRLEAHFAKA